MILKQAMEKKREKPKDAVLAFGGSGEDSQGIKSGFNRFSAKNRRFSM